METFEIIFLIVALIVTLVWSFGSVIRFPHTILWFTISCFVVVPKFVRQIKENGGTGILNDTGFVMNFFEDVKRLQLPVLAKYVFSFSVWGSLIYIIYF